MEANGNISFLPKGEFKNPTKHDLKLDSQKSYLSANIIVNGEYMEESIKKSQISYRGRKRLRYVLYEVASTDQQRESRRAKFGRSIV